MRTARPTSSNAGFTLLEILLASVAAALILAAVYTVFVQAIHLRDRADGRVHDARVRERAEKILRDDLNNALVSGGVFAASLTGGSNNTGGPSGSSLPGYLKFTATNGKSSSGDVASDVQQIEYYLVPATGANAAATGQNNGGVLTRAVTRDLLGSTTQTTAKEESILAGVQALQVQFYDGANWQDSWSYTSPDNTNSSSSGTSGSTASTTVTTGNAALPTAVRVDVQLVPSTTNGQPPPPIEILVPWTTQPFTAATPQPLGHLMKPTSNRGRRDGSVLIIVLVVCLGLISMTLVFSHSMLLSYRGADNDLAGRQADAAILGAEQYAEMIMSQAQNTNILPDRTSYQSTAVPLGDAFFWFIGRPLASDPTNAPAFALVDEASKLNLNAASAYSLSLLPNMTTDFAQVIHDWRVDPSNSTSSGVQLSAVKGAAYESPEELALVNGGIDPSVLYGDDANLNHCLDPEEGNGTGGGALGQFNPGLLEYVTTFSREPNTMSDGTTKRGNVQVSSGVRGFLSSLTAALGSDAADQIAGKFPPVGGRPQTFRSVAEFGKRAGLTADQWDKVTPYLTIGTGTYNVGMVNVNTASATVLACLPGMNADLAAQLIAARAQQSTPSTNLQWVASILPGNVLRSAGRWMTTRSYQISADIAAVGRHGRGYRRTLFVIDFSAMNITGATKPQIVYRHNLSGLGWALGNDARTSLPTVANAAAGTATQKGASSTP